MNYTRWLISGFIIFLVSMGLGTIGMVWWLYSVASDPNHHNSIRADGSMEMPGVMYAAGFMLLGCLAGGIMIIVGGVKAYRAGKSKDIGPSR